AAFEYRTGGGGELLVVVHYFRCVVCVVRAVNEVRRQSPLLPCLDGLDRNAMETGEPPLDYSGVHHCLGSYYHNNRLIHIGSLEILVCNQYCIPSSERVGFRSSIAIDVRLVAA